MSGARLTEEDVTSPLTSAFASRMRAIKDTEISKLSGNSAEAFSAEMAPELTRALNQKLDEKEQQGH
ncbi:hypothetical protein SSP35_04_04060 [Streptomyces sp. NBRC 110611]|uniref:hypothetical protein n=1 Tax=Streptomyces sp. NBRC 110611 TaxID=1621259 RepID=UPI0008555D24|nr:hypothetical protein [Streptomyces sp. NBRC 110611]GAU67318.1 hypothetical protein SSP35_04_04060 [Streptomyces sp. NBRC 110611]